jgi:putative transposase
MDALSTGRRLKIFTLLDDFTRESLDLAIAHSICGEQITQILVLHQGYFDGAQ